MLQQARFSCTCSISQLKNQINNEKQGDLFNMVTLEEGQGDPVVPLHTLVQWSSTFLMLRPFNMFLMLW